MPMEEDLLTRLDGLGGAAADWFDRPSVFPAIIMTKIDAGREWTHDGPDGLDEPRVRFECWALMKAEAGALARALRGEMEQPRVVGGTQFHEGVLELEAWDKVDDLPGGATAFRIIHDYSFFHEGVAQ